MNQSQTKLQPPSDKVWFQVIIDCCEGTEEEIVQTLQSINQQKLSPQKIIAVHTNGRGEPTFNLLKEYITSSSWSLVEILEDMPDWRDFILINYKNNCQMFMFVKPGLTLDEDFLYNLSQDMLNKNLVFGLLEGERFLIVPYGVYFLLFPDVPLRFLAEELDKAKVARIKYDESLCSKN